MKARIILADDHNLVRAGIRVLLERIPGVEVVGEAAEGQEVVRLVEEKKPNIVLLDVGMPGLSGIEVMIRLKKERPDLKVVMLTGHTSEEFVVRALQNGASGYMLKGATVEELEGVLKVVLNDQVYVSPRFVRGVVAELLKKDTETTNVLEVLSSRQREILQLIAEGKNTKEIAFILDISVKTVETHRAQLMDRLGIHDVPGLVRYAIRTGLVSAEL